MKSIIWIFISIMLLSINSFAQERSDQLYTSTDVDYLNKVIEENKILTDDNQALKNIGIAYHQLALMKKNGASEQAVEYLEKYRKSSPDDMVSLAYLGSSYAMLARDSSAVFKKVTNVNKGLGLLDKAVNALPNDYIPRIIRASVTYSIPGMFNRSKTSFADYEFLIAHFELSNDLLSEFNYKLGTLAQQDDRPDEAKTFFERSITANPASEWASKAKEAIK